MKKLLLSVCASSGLFGAIAIYIYLFIQFPIATTGTALFILVTSLFYIMLAAEEEKRKRVERFEANLLRLTSLKEEM